MRIIESDVLESLVSSIDVRTDQATRAAYSFDASTHQIEPAAVAFPRTSEEVAQVLAVCSAAGVPVTVRGGGTSMAGNAVGRGVIIDMSRHMTRILLTDPNGRTATVQAGVVLDALRQEVEPWGLDFGPDPSSHNRCTLGGMFGNDACGNRSLRTGRTGSQVVSVVAVLASGTRVRVERDRVTAIDPADQAEADRLREDLVAIGDRYLSEIRRSQSGIPRQVSGFQLQHLLPETRHLTRSLAGSEGTCAIVTELTVQLVRRPHARSLMVLGFAGIVDAARASAALLELRPAAIEGLDVRLVDTLRQLRGDEAASLLPDGRAWLLVEFHAEDQEAALRINARAREIAESTVTVLSHRTVDGADAQRSLWRIREEGAGLASRSASGVPAWSGWEDSAVDPHRLPEYLASLESLMAQHGYAGALYGHFGAGCVHVRLDFDLTTESGRSDRGAFLREAAALVASFGGSLSGEHGDGRARSDLLEVMYPPSMITAFAEFKAAWDPSGVLNPGIIASPEPGSVSLLYPAVDGLGWQRGLSYPRDHDDFAEAVGRCVGVGKCRSASGGFMCPSYRATAEEVDSTRGRARVLQDMIAGRIPGGVHSAAVADALDLCLSCKACATDCPAGVDMASYKTDVLATKYRGRLRPRSHYALGWLPIWLRATRLPGLIRAANAVLSTRWGARSAKYLAGIAPERSLPRIAPPARSLPRDPQATAIVFEDSFTRSFRPEVAGAVGELLRQAGFVPAGCGKDVCCGLTLITTGQLPLARRLLRRTVRALSTPELAGLPVVVPEPSCASALRHDLPRLLPDERSQALARRVHTVSSFLKEHAPDWKPTEPLPEVALQVHCHERAVFGQDGEVSLLRDLGAAAVTSSDGCCGLAGNFGFEREHFETSLKVAETALRPLVRRMTPGTVLVADGFSCSLQASQLEGEPGLHVAELLVGVRSSSESRRRRFGDVANR